MCAARGYPPPYGDLVDGSDHRDRPEPGQGMPGQGMPGTYPQAAAHQSGGYGGGAQSIAAAPRPGELPPAATPASGQWGAPAPASDQEQSRFDAFRPDAAQTAGETSEAKPDPAPQVRNGRVLIAVLIAAALLVAIPLSLVWLITRPGDQTFDPAVGACVKQSGNTAVPADCTESGAYQVISKVEQVSQCDDPNAPHIQMPAASGREQVLCLRSAADPVPQSSTDPGTETTD